MCLAILSTTGFISMTHLFCFIFLFYRITVFSNRRQEIIDDFKVLSDVQKQVIPFSDTFTWAFSSEEQPNSLTEVRQEEIDVMLERANPGVFDIEQRKLERSGKSGAEEKGDSDAKKQRTRALVDMMSGVLEIKEDIFSTDVPVPKFMDKFGDECQEESEWTEEMKKTAKTYAKQCKLLEETRLKHKQQLLSEAKKLIDQDNASANSFDNALQDLCAAKSNSDAEQHSILLQRVEYSLCPISSIWRNTVDIEAPLKTPLNAPIDAPINSFEEAILNTRFFGRKFHSKNLKNDQISAYRTQIFFFNALHELLGWN